MNKKYIYGYYSVHNHGNEAIIRGLQTFFNKNEIIVLTDNIEDDREYGLNENCILFDMSKYIMKYSLVNIIGHFLQIIRKGNDSFRLKKKYGAILGNIDSNDVFLFEAGDQCFEEEIVINNYITINRILKKTGAKLIFFAGSIPCNNISALLPFLEQFDTIIVRESISYRAVLQTKLKEKVYLMPCSAFQMLSNCSIECPNTEKKVLGLSIGYLGQGKECYNDFLVDNITNLIQFVIDNTDYDIWLIPHVNIGRLSDVYFFQDIERILGVNKRIIRFRELRADVVKNLISKCNVFVTVRTHASIAAYSMCVPTLVIGYSQKSKGIAQDIFGNLDLLFDIEKLKEKEQLIEGVMELINNKEYIKEYLTRKMPIYLNSLQKIKSIVEEGTAGETN